MNKLFAAVLLVLLYVSAESPLHADTVKIAGHMASNIEFHDRYTVVVPEGVRSLTITIPLPQSAQLFGYSQIPGTVSVVPSLPPDSTKQIVDSLGNQYQVDSYFNPKPGMLVLDLGIPTATIAVDLAAPFPHQSIDRISPTPDIALYLKASPRVESEDPEIVKLAHRFIQSDSDEAVAVQQIQAWLQQNIIYNGRQTAVSDDALAVLHTRAAICSGWANLFIALARADKIPARFVGGVDLGGAITFPSDTDGTTSMTLKSRCEPHSWIEVWFPSAGWVPCDPQATAGFIDPHHLKLWNGLDSDSVEKFVTWSSIINPHELLAISETEYPAHLVDDITLTCVKTTEEQSQMTLLERCNPEDLPSTTPVAPQTSSTTPP